MPSDTNMMLLQFQKEALAKHIIGMVLEQQYNLTTYLKMFVYKSEKSVTNQFTYLHNMETCIPMDSTKLTKHEIVEEISSLAFLLDKRGDRVKSRGCADGHK